MARIKFGALVTEINGSIGGTTFQRNRYGFTVKQKPISAANNKVKQFERQACMPVVDAAWRALLPTQRAAWETYATTFPRPTRLDPTVSLNGFNYFQAYHLRRSLYDSTIRAVPSGQQESFSFNFTDVENDDPNLNWVIDFNTSGGTWIFLLFLSAPIASTSYARQSRLKFIASSLQSGNTVINVGPQYLNTFGFIPSIGDTLLISNVALKSNNGQIFIESIRKVVVV